MTTKKLSLRDQIFNAQDIQEEIITVPQWGNAKILIKGLDGKARSDLMSGTVDAKGNVNISKMYMDLVIQSCFDPETGEKLFSIGDIQALQKKSGAALDVIQQAAMKLSGLDSEGRQDMAKNFGISLNGDSASS